MADTRRFGRRRFAIRTGGRSCVSSRMPRMAMFSSIRRCSGLMGCETDWMDIGCQLMHRPRGAPSREAGSCAGAERPRLAGICRTASRPASARSGHCPPSGIQLLPTLLGGSANSRENICPKGWLQRPGDPAIGGRVVRRRVGLPVVSATGIGPGLAGTASGGRRLIAVVYADMVGYSRLIGLDDAGTLRRLRTLRRALIDPAIREHGGRIVQTGGDSLLVAFDSIDGAVRCAVKGAAAGFGVPWRPTARSSHPLPRRHQHRRRHSARHRSAW